MKKNKSSKIEKIVSVILIIVIAGYYLLDNVNLSTVLPKDDVIKDVGDSKLSVNFIDVGQGDGQVLISEDFVMVVDSGTVAGSKSVIEKLNSLNVTEIDYLVATHPHADHIGGMNNIVDQFHIRNVVMPDIIDENEPTTKVYMNFLESLSNSVQEDGTNVIFPTTGQVIYESDSLFIQSLNDSTIGDSTKNLNNYSVSLLVRHGNVGFILTGDAEIPLENDILKSNINLKAQVMAAGHHGSTTSNSEPFMKAVNPELVIISAGEDNRYGHPHREVVQYLKDNNIKYLETKNEGNIEVVSDGNSYIIK